MAVLRFYYSLGRAGAAFRRQYTLDAAFSLILLHVIFHAIFADQLYSKFR